MRSICVDQAPQFDVGAQAWAYRAQQLHLRNVSIGPHLHSWRDGGVSALPVSRLEPPSLGELETYIDQFLFVCLRCVKLGGVRAIFSQPHWVRLFFRLALPSLSSVAGSTAGAGLGRMRRLLSMRILRLVLPTLELTNAAFGTVSTSFEQCTCSFSSLCVGSCRWVRAPKRMPKPWSPLLPKVPAPPRAAVRV